MIPESFIQELLSRIDIVEVINKVVPLKRTGKNYMACCPFHREKTPSFSVSPQKQFFKCFGCGASGSVIGFVMKYEGLGYVEAVRKLAESVGMTVPEDPRGQERRARARTLSDDMKEAADFYTQCLKNNARAIDYLKMRAITGETAARFALGYSPEGWQNLKDVFGSHYESKELEDEGCGLVIRNENGRRYDRFRGRIMFPIRNPRGQVIAFGARTMNGDEHPKYLNSPETAIYRKGHEIYGLYEANRAIRDKGRTIVCEGYMDVIQLSQAGFPEACAALGTAVTADHVRKLLRMVKKIYFCFDGDEAGQHALRRAMEASLPAVGDEHEIRFVVLPPEHDPDSLIKAQGAQAFEDELEKSLTLTQFFVKTLTAGKDLYTAEGRSQFLAESKPLIVSMSAAPFLREQLVGELAMHARMNPDELQRAFGIAHRTPAAAAASALAQTQSTVPGRFSSWGAGRRYGGNYGRNYGNARFGRPQVRIDPIEASDMRERMLQNFLNYPVLAVEFSAQIEDEFIGNEDPVAREILEVWRAVSAGDVPVEHPQVLMERLAGSPNIAHYGELLANELIIQTPIAAARSELEMAFDRLELQRVTRELTEAVSSARPNIELVRTLSELQKKLRERIAQAKQEQALSGYAGDEGEGEAAEAGEPGGNHGAA